MRHFWLLVLTIGVWGCSSDNENESTERQEELTSENLLEQAPYGKEQTLFWNYEDDFNDEEKRKLISWIEQVILATTQTIGQYPFDIQFIFHRVESENSPVVFGKTSRGTKPQGVHLYVDPTFPEEDMLADWTAPHEISHLSQPFLGKSNSWFAEGYATYLSRQIMITMGYYTEASFDSMYMSKITDIKPIYNEAGRTFIQITDSLKSNRRYGAFYWGGASFFMSMDMHLQEEHDRRFRDVVEEYQQCCRLKDKNIEDVIASYDNIIGEHCCRDLYDKYLQNPSKDVMENY